ncbi:MAG: hypothetical protein WCI20_15545, partial [bacterium]
KAVLPRRNEVHEGKIFVALGLRAWFPQQAVHPPVVRRKAVVRKSCAAVGADNASSRLRRDVHPMDLTTHMHSSEKPNRAFRQY